VVGSIVHTSDSIVGRIVQLFQYQLHEHYNFAARIKPMVSGNPSDVPNLTAWELLTVIALAEHGSFVATSAYLHTSQPAVTRTLKRLEKRLGVVLFARSTRHVEITAAGREFVAVAERVLHDLQITVRSMRDISTEQRGQVIVSTYSAFAYQVLPPILHAYRETRPQIDVRLREGRQPDILEDVRSGVADFGVGFVDGLATSVATTTLRREPLYVILPGNHPLAVRRPETLPFAAIRSETLVSLPVDSFTRRLVDGAAAAAGLHIRHALVVTRFESVVHYVRAGAGIGVVPAGALPVMPAKDFHAARLVEPSLFVTLGLIMLTGRYMTPAAESLMTMIKDGVGPMGASAPGLPAPGGRSAARKTTHRGGEATGKK
jgi:DNA-binding transcriptional LysR family regulator